MLHFWKGRGSDRVAGPRLSRAVWCSDGLEPVSKLSDLRIAVAGKNHRPERKRQVPSSTSAHYTQF